MLKRKKTGYFTFFFLPFLLQWRLWLTMYMSGWELFGIGQANRGQFCFNTLLWQSTNQGLSQRFWAVWAYATVLCGWLLWNWFMWRFENCLAVLVQLRAIVLLLTPLLKIKSHNDDINTVGIGLWLQLGNAIKQCSCHHVDVMLGFSLNSFLEESEVKKNKGKKRNGSNIS